MKSRSSVNAGTLVPEWEAICDEILTEGGVESALRALGLRALEPDLESCVWKVLNLWEERNVGRFVLTDTSFELASEQLNGDDRKMFNSHSVEIREWIRAMDLARPLNTREEGSMLMASWVHKVILATEG